MFLEKLRLDFWIFVYFSFFIRNHKHLMLAIFQQKKAIHKKKKKISICYYYLGL